MRPVDPASWRRAQPALDRLLDLPPDKRASFLEELSRTDPESADLVRAVAGPDTTAGVTNQLRGVSELIADRPQLAGQQVGRYTLVAPLGEGGMGSVWRARRSDGTYEGEAAVKLLHATALDPARIARFHREASLLAGLSHPNIAGLLDAGITSAGQPFLVLELVDGVRIDQYCTDHALSVEARIRLVLQVCAAVSRAHASLIVHRDIKPSNILVTPPGVVKLLDFGIARLVEQGDARAPEASAYALTPEYAAPEQIRQEPVTTACDVYATGVLLHLLLAGSHPTGAGCHTPAELMQATLERPPARLGNAVMPSSLRSGESAARHAQSLGLAPSVLQRRLGGDLENIVSLALRKGPSERYPGIDALADDLQRHLGHEPVRARPASARYRFAKLVRRNRAAVAAGAGALVMLLLTTALVLQQSALARQERDEARVQRDRAVFEARRASASSGFMQTLLSTMGPAGEKLGTVELLDRARERLERDYSSDPRFISRMMVELAEQYEALEDIVGRRMILERALAFAARSGDPETIAFAECSIALYLATVEVDRISEARTHLTLAAARPTAQAPPAARTHARCLLAEARVAGVEGNLDSAIVLAAAAVARVRGSADTNSIGYVGALVELGLHLGRNGQRRASLATAQGVVATLVRIDRGNTLQAVKARRSEMHGFTGLGELRSADSVRSVWLEDAVALGLRMAPWVELEQIWRAEYRQQPESAVELRRPILNRARAIGDRSGVTNALLAMVPDLLDAGRAPEAESALAEAIRFRQPPDSTRLVLLEGRVAEAVGDLPGAHRYYGIGLASLGFPRSTVVGPAEGAPLHFYRGYVLRAARVALKSGDLVAADSLGRHYLRLLDDMEQDSLRSGEIGRGLMHLGRVRLARGDSVGGRLTMLRAIAPLRHGMGPDHPATREVMRFLDSVRVPAFPRAAAQPGARS